MEWEQTIIDKAGNDMLHKQLACGIVSEYRSQLTSQEETIRRAEKLQEFMREYRSPDCSFNFAKPQQSRLPPKM